MKDLHIDVRAVTHEEESRQPAQRIYGTSTQPFDDTVHAIRTICATRSRALGLQHAGCGYLRGRTRLCMQLRCAQGAATRTVVYRCVR